jgi:hypothetical protein
VKSSFISLLAFTIVLISALANAQDTPRTLVLPPDSELSLEQRTALQSQAESAKTGCHSKSSHLIVVLDLVVPEIYPTSGISPAEVVAFFLKGTGIPYANIKRGQIARPLAASEVVGRTVQFAFSCQS